MLLDLSGNSIASAMVAPEGKEHPVNAVRELIAASFLDKGEMCWDSEFFRMELQRRLPGIESLVAATLDVGLDGAADWLWSTLLSLLQADDSNWVLISREKGKGLVARAEFLTSAPRPQLYGGSLLAAFRQVINQYCREREQAWEFLKRWWDPATNRVVDEFRHHLSAVLRGASDLGSGFEEGTALAASLDGVPDASAWVEEAISLSVCSTALRRAEIGMPRYRTLIERARHHTASPIARRYLCHVSECFVFGFDTESIIMSRAVLEAEFEAAIDNSDCIAILGTPRTPQRVQFDLADRIGVAVRLNRVTSQAAEAARRVKDAANKRLHRDPAGELTALSVIESTLVVLQELTSTRK